MIVENHVYTYKDALNGVIIKNTPPEFDCLNEARLKAFLSNPFITDLSLPMLVYSTIDDAVVGWLMFFPTRLLIDGKEEVALSASNFRVLDAFQHLAIGVDLAMFPIRNMINKYLLYAGPSTMALKMYKKMRFISLSMPYYERNQRFTYLDKTGFKPISHNVLAWGANSLIRLRHSFEAISVKRQGYKIQEHDVIPRWIETVLKQDKHRFCEVHNRAWFQWNLENHFHNEAENNQHFYGVYKEGQPIGFFLTSERLRKEKVYGFLMEWGSIDNTLSEFDILRLAIPTFSRGINRIGVAISDKSILESLKKLGFRKKRDYYIVFRESSHQLSGSSEPENWRMRLGYADVVLSS